MNIESSAKSNYFKITSMTNKTQFAMFAIAAIAIMSFGMTPAFAASYGSAQVTATTYSATSSEDVISCCSGDCKTKINLNNPQDRITYFIGAVGNNCDVSISLTGIGSTYTRDHGTIGGQVHFDVNRTINTGDTATITATYSNCT